MWPGRYRRPEDLTGLGCGHVPGGQAQGRVEISLHGQARSDPAPRLVEGDPPVDADHRAPGRGHGGQQFARAHAEEDGGNVGVGARQLGEEPPGGRQHQLPVVVRGEDPGPAVEDLHGRGPGVQLGPQGRQGQITEPLGQFVPDLGVSVHQRLHLGEVLGRTTLDQVAGHGEGPAGEADQRDLQLARTGCPPPPPHRACRSPVRGAGGAAGPRRRRRAGHHRTGPRSHVDAETDGRHRDHDVGEEDGGVGPVAVDRLAGQAGHQIRLGDGIEDAPRPRAARYSGRDRPACRMNQTGTWSTGSPRQARTNGAPSNRPGTYSLTSTGSAGLRRGSTRGGRRSRGRPGRRAAARRGCS